LHSVRLADERVALFLVNQRAAAIDVDLELAPSIGNGPGWFAVTRTDAESAASPGGHVALDGGAGRVRLPGRSITTLVTL
jgi:hypothetical protein